MKLLIVDDEPNTRKGLQDLMNWKSIGIGEVITAGDGLEALDIINRIVPDVLICDVRMPRMNGPELVGRLRQDDRYQNIQVIFLSGFSDKEYLKAAIRYQAVDYIEKPIDIGQVENVVSKAVQRIHSNERKDDDRLIMELAQDNPGAVTTIENLWGSSLCYRALYIGFKAQEAMVGTEQVEKLLELLKDRFTHILLSRQHSFTWAVLIAGTARDIDDSQIRKVFTCITQKTQPSLIPAMAAGKLVDGASGIVRSLNEAQRICDRFFFDGYGHLYLKARFPSRSLQYLDSLYELLMNHLAKKEYDRLPALTDNMECELRAVDISVGKARMFALQVILKIRQNLYAWQSDAFPVVPEDCLMESLEECSTLKDVFDFVSDSTEAMLKAVYNQISRGDLASKVRDYLDDHYTEAVTLDILSEVFCY